MSVKNSTKMELSEGGVSSRISSKEGVAYHECCCEKNIVSMQVLNLFHDLVSCLKVLMGVGTKSKTLMRTDNSSSVNVWSERLCIMFLLYWEVYVLMDLVVNLRNEDLHWFWEDDYFFCFRMILHFLVPVCNRVGTRLWIPNACSCVGSV